MRSSTTCHSNIAQRASEAGIETENRVFDAACARDVLRWHGAAAAVIGNNVLAHVDEPVDFLAACKTLLAPEGLVIVEVPELYEFVQRLEYDTVYHEHLSYFSLTALMKVCEEAGLRIVRADHVPVHGGSLRMYAAAEVFSTWEYSADFFIHSTRSLRCTSDSAAKHQS